MIEEQDFLNLYESCLRIRSIENALALFYLENRVFSFVHFSSGQELAPVAVSSVMLDSDRVFGNHRSHAHYLAAGGDAVKMVKEMLGSEEGCCGGYGGSMHLRDLGSGFFGSSPVLGSIAPIAAGSSFQQKIAGDINSISVAFIGDGASEEGVVAETLNLMAVFRLPLLLVIENNQYAVNTPRSVRRHADFSFRAWGEAYGLKVFEVSVDEEVESYVETCRDSIAFVRSERLPALLVAESFRHLAHSSPLTDDHLGYRERDKPEIRNDMDFLATMRSEILAKGWNGLGEVEVRVSTEVRNLTSLASEEWKSI